LSEIKAGYIGWIDFTLDDMCVN